MKSLTLCKLSSTIRLTLIIAAVCTPLAGQAKRFTEQPQPVSQIQDQTTAKIQIAILLDTSGSMDGLIEQAKSQLWHVVNEFTQARHEGIRPVLQVAVYQYGNSGLSSENGYIQQLTPLTTDLDRVSEALFSLQTNGGDEFCGYAIQTALTELQWGTSANDVKAIFIAGNEPFSQGPVNYKQAVAKASQKGVEVNTIYAGDFNTGKQEGWFDGAVLAGGSYSSINHNYEVVHIEAPQDKQLAELNRQLNDTYIPYGVDGEKGKSRQMEQDRLSHNKSLSFMASRAESKASGAYQNSSWDLNDAVNDGSIELSELPESALPEKMQALTLEEREVYVEESINKRKAIQKQISILSKERNAYITAKKREKSETQEKTLNQSLIASVKKQAARKNYTFNSN